MSNHSHRQYRSTVFLTGATGFIGHYVLGELLAADYRVFALTRAARQGPADRLGSLLGDIGRDVATHIENGSLVPVVGDLFGNLPTLPGVSFDAVIHIAASTRFDMDSIGEPRRTNVEGTKHLLGWATDHGIDELHAVSSAYVCGRADSPEPELLRHDPPAFHNAYEESKWEMEQLCREWASQVPSRKLTTYRPSIVVGAFNSGRATKFDGLYLAARAIDLLSKSFGADDPERFAINLRLKGRGFDVQNIVPVDYVAKMIRTGVDEPSLHGRVYHLVNPHPPTNDEIKRAINQHFDVAGGRWIPPHRFDESELSESERLFHELNKPIEHYFVDSPSFVRHNVARIEAHASYGWRAYDESAFGRLFAYAQSVKWGKLTRPKEVTPFAANRASEGDSIRDYFTRFLPEKLPLSEVAAMTALTVTVRFDINDAEDGQWHCSFQEGRLAKVINAPNEYREDFTYHLSSEVFWKAVKGAVHPQQVFLDGDVTVTGNVEQALKMAMILHAFNQEHPFDANQSSQGQPIAEVIRSA